MRKQNSLKKGISAFSIAIFCILMLYVISLVFPLFWALITSFKGKLDFLRHPFDLPTKWIWENLKTAADNYLSPYNKDGVVRTVYIAEMARNSLIYAVGGSFLGTFVVCIVAYASARFNTIFGKLIYTIVIVTMTLPIVGSLPSEIQIIKTLGLYDTMVGMLILNCGFLGMHFLIFYATFESIPKEYTEAAYVDGASNFTVLFKIMLPLIINAFMTIMLIRFIGLWNDYNMTMQYTPNIKTLAFGLYEYSLSYNPAISGVPMKLAGCCILMVPVLILFVCFHERIMGNVALGGIKE